MVDWVCITRIMTYIAAAFMGGVALTVWILIFVLAGETRPIQLIESVYYV